jgi:hypothetical protein
MFEINDHKGISATYSFRFLALRKQMGKRKKIQQDPSQAIPSCFPQVEPKQKRLSRLLETVHFLAIDPGSIYLDIN